MDKRFTAKINRCIKRVADGEMSGLEELFVLTRKYLFAVALSYLSDKGKAEDILSETYCRVVKNADKFDGKQNGCSWLYEIVKNLSLNQNRSDTVRAYIPIEETDAGGNCFTEALLDKIMAEKAQSILSGDEKEILYEYFFEGKTIQQIADRIGRPKTTAYEMLRRILKKMKNQL